MACASSFHLHKAGFFHPATSTDWPCDHVIVTSSPGPYFLSRLQNAEEQAPMWNVRWNVIAERTGPVHPLPRLPCLAQYLARGRLLASVGWMNAAVFHPAWPRTSCPMFLIAPWHAGPFPIPPGLRRPCLLIAGAPEDLRLGIQLDACAQCYGE